jgi:hypothetical protein
MCSTPDCGDARATGQVPPVALCMSPASGDYRLSALHEFDHVAVRVVDHRDRHARHQFLFLDFEAHPGFFAVGTNLVDIAHLKREIPKTETVL